MDACVCSCRQLASCLPSIAMSTPPPTQAATSAEAAPPVSSTASNEEPIADAPSGSTSAAPEASPSTPPLAQASVDNDDDDDDEPPAAAAAATEPELVDNEPAAAAVSAPEPVAADLPPASVVDVLPRVLELVVAVDENVIDVAAMSPEFAAQLAYATSAVAMSKMKRLLEVRGAAWLSEARFQGWYVCASELRCVYLAGSMSFGW